jgi:hypothetical protein
MYVLRIQSASRSSDESTVLIQEKEPHSTRTRTSTGRGTHARNRAQNRKLQNSTTAYIHTYFLLSSACECECECKCECEYDADKRYQSYVSYPRRVYYPTKLKRGAGHFTRTSGGGVGVWYQYQRAKGACLSGENRVRYGAVTYQAREGWRGNTHNNTPRPDERKRNRKRGRGRILA